MTQRQGRATGSASGARRRPQAGARSNGTRRPQMKARRGSGGRNWLREQFSRRPLPVWVLVVADVLVFAVALNVFALFHHVLPRREQAVGITSQRAPAADTAQAAQAPAADAAQEAQIDAGATSDPAQEAQATPAPEDPEGVFGTKFADKFTDGSVERDANSYRSANINMTLTDYTHGGVNFHVIDFYLRDITSFTTGFAKDSFGRGMYEKVQTVVDRIGALAGINGDFYGGRSDGVVARNGTLYRNDDHLKRDVCVLYWDGTMETYSPEGFDAEAEMARGAYQMWNFGPMLLDSNGQPMEKFNSNVNPRNPRSAIGYFEPGHYCLVAVDGRSDVSKGLTLKNMSLLMQTLGCVRGYNLDGGDSSVMVFDGRKANVPSSGGRTCSDVVAIAEPDVVAANS